MSRSVLVALDSFDGVFTAREACAALGDVLAEDSAVGVRQRPIAGGGEGTLDAVLAAGWDRVSLESCSPVGKPNITAYARTSAKALIEVTELCGVEHPPGDTGTRLDATSAGVGEAMAHALDHGADEVILALGGSACADGGAGMIHALGGVFRDSHGEPVTPSAGVLRSLELLDWARPAGRFVVSADQDKPLLGPHGTVSTIGPGSSTTPAQVAQLEVGLRHWARLVRHHVGFDSSEEPGTGAAGGVGFAARSLLHAQIRAGTSLIFDLIGFDDALADVDVVITGAGRLDAQTPRSGAFVGAVKAATARGIPVEVVCWSSELTPRQRDKLGLQRIWSLTQHAGEERAAADPHRALAGVGRDLARTLARDRPAPAKKDA